MQAIRNAVIAVSALAILTISANAGGRSCGIKGGDSFVLRNGGVTMMSGEGMSADSLRAQSLAHHDAECDKRLCALADEAIKNGKATPVN